LPSDRSIAFGSTTSTSTVTPIEFLTSAASRPPAAEPALDLAA
jgi:hypothetical protein